MKVCNKHPKYKAIRKPIGDCSTCLELYDAASTVVSDELKKLYIYKKKTLNEIANFYSCSINAIYYRLNKFNIPVRTVSEAHRVRNERHVIISSHLADVLNGLLLSDGSLYNKANFQASYRQTSSQWEFVNYVAELFATNGYPRPVVHNYRKNDYSVRSITTAELGILHNNWYSNNVKRIPLNVKLTPATVLFWYLGDGTKDKYNSTILCTDSFTLAECEFLISSLKDIDVSANLIVRKVRNMKQYRLYIQAKTRQQFFSYMGQNPVACYDYKFPLEYRMVRM